jgi:hypothetical protein
MSFRRNHEDSGHVSAPAHGQKRRNTHLSTPQHEAHNQLALLVCSDRTSRAPVSAPPRTATEPELDMLLASVSLRSNMNASSAESTSAHAAATAADSTASFASASHDHPSSIPETEHRFSSGASRRQKAARRDIFDITLVLETGARMTVEMPSDQLLRAVFEHLREAHGRRYDSASTLLRHRGRTLNADLEIIDCTAPPLPRRCVLHVVPLPQNS